MAVKIDGTGYIGSANNIYTAGDGKVGIGTTSPTANVDIQGRYPRLWIGETSSTDNVEFFMKQSDNTTEGLKLTYESITGDGYINSVYSGGRIHLQTNSSSKLIVDSSGRVTMPSQPVWVAQGSSESWYNTVGTVPFNYTYYTRNCTYDTTNSRFTAPVAGVYNIAWTFLAGTNGNGGHISLRKNGSYINEVMHGQSGSAEYDYTGGSVPVYLAVGDYVDLYMSATFSQGIYMGSNAGRYALFSGFLIG